MPQQLEQWDRAAEALTKTRERATEDALDRSVRTALQAAASDTGAIEGLYAHDRGFTISVSTEAATWEAALATRSPDVRVFLEAQLLAYELALDAATRAMPIGEAWIRRLHEVLAAPQKTYDVLVDIGGRLYPQKHPLPLGEYKTNPNHVHLRDGTFHSYAPVDRTGAEMQRLVSEISSDAFQQAHPVMQSAYAHYALAAVHPFADGNGRVARALASVFLLRRASIPLVVFFDDKDRYLDALAAADGGRPESFVRFVADRSIATMRLVETQLQPGPEPGFDRLRELLTPPGSPAYGDLVGSVDALLDAVKAEVEEQVREDRLPRGVKALVGYQRSGLNHVVPGYHEASGADGYRTLFVVLQSGAPSAGTSTTIGVFLRDPARDDPILLECELRDRHASLAVSADEILPAYTAAFRARLSSWVRSIVGDLAKQLADQVESIIRRST